MEDILRNVKENLVEKEVEKFFLNVRAASRKNQTDVNALMWPALEVLSEDELWRKYFLQNLEFYAWSDAVRSSVFTAPVLDKESVKTIFGAIQSVAYFPSTDLLALVARDEFDAKLFALVVKNFCIARKAEAINFMSLVNAREKIPLEWWVEAYYVDVHISFREVMNLSFPNGYTFVGSVESFILERICPYYPDMPKAYVKQMLDSLRNVPDFSLSEMKSS